MGRRNSYWVDPREDDGSDAGDPFEAGQEFLRSVCRGTREAIEGVRAVEAGPGTSEHSGDGPTLHGPQPRLQFYWHGQRCDFRHAEDRYALVTALWDAVSGAPHAERDRDEVLDVLYGEDEEGTKTEAKRRQGRLKNLRLHVGKAFLDAGIALRVGCGGGKVWLEELP